MTTNKLTLAQYVKQDAVTTRLNELLGKRAPQFVTSLVSAANANTMLANCAPETVLTAALTAASMDLPINQNLGFAYLIPYKNKSGEVCQFQMGYKGFIQLAQRSGYYKTINATDVREGEMIGFDRLSGELSFNWLDDSERNEAKVVGYVAYFQLLNGFEKSLFMTTDELEKHANKYSENYAKYKSGLWADNFDSMAKKTVLKLLISKFGPLSTQLEDAIQKDQTVEGEYVDNPNKVEVVEAELGDSEESEKEDVQAISEADK